MPSDPIPSSSAKPPKQRSGCLLALYIMLGIGATLLVVTGIGIFLFARSEQGQKLIKVASEGISLARDAAQAPGTNELRAAGCSQAMVMPTARMIELLGEISPDARKELPETFNVGTLVLCQLDSSGDTGPDCDQVARIYADAAPNAPERFGVMVQPRQGQAKCEGSYGRDGTFLGSLEK